MRELSTSHIVVGLIATNCWIYPFTESQCQKALQLDALHGIKLPDGYQGCALIDPGADARQIIAHLDSLKLIPLYILLTHGHFDHIGAVPFLVTEYRKLLAQDNARFPLIAIHSADAQYLGPDSYQEHCRSITAVTGSSAFIDALWKNMPSPDLLLEEGMEIGPFTVLHIPGHTPGSIAFWDKEAGNLFTGDTLFLGDYGRTDLPGGNETQIINSLKRLLAMDEQIKVHPGHGHVTNIGQEVVRGII